MRTKIDFAELHGPLFLAGKNHGLKLFNKAGLALEYDEDKKQLFATYGGKTSRIPEANMSSFMEAGQVAQPDAPAPAPVNKVKAQVWTPQDHVHANAPGKTKD